MSIKKRGRGRPVQFTEEEREERRKYQNKKSNEKYALRAGRKKRTKEETRAQQREYRKSQREAFPPMSMAEKIYVFENMPAGLSGGAAAGEMIRRVRREFASAQ